MTCREFNDFMIDYLSAELAVEVRADFERHLADCPNCLRYLESYEVTVAVSRVAFNSLERELPVEVPEELIQAILSAQKQA
jgi:anti-sigma factor RsiW